MTDSFKVFEYLGWQQAVDRYDRSFGRLTRRAVPPMLTALGVGPGVRLLDVACGPGYLAAAARDLGADATGVDFAESMVERARMRHPDVRFGVGDAEVLAGVADESFDAAGMNFGILHLSRPDAALRSMYRVLKPGGRVAFTAWDRPERAVGFDLVLRAIEAAGDPTVPVPQGPPFFHYSDPAACDDLLTAAGFTRPASAILKLCWELGSPDELFDAFLTGTARTGGLLRAQPADRLASVREAVVTAAAGHCHGARVILPMPVRLAWAAKPG